MKVVSDASFLIALAGLDRLSLLQERFPDGIMVPPSVWREVVEQGGNRAGAESVKKSLWIQVESVDDRNFVRFLNATLDEGEAEAIALARERCADVVLLDEKAARHAAAQLGLRVLGVVGLLVWARQSRRLENLREELDRLRNKVGFYLHPSVLESALHEAGE